MRENPLIELAEDFEYDADLVIDLSEAANCELRKARILRAAAEVIEAVHNWQRCTAEDDWKESRQMVDALTAYKAACKEK